MSLFTVDREKCKRDGICVDECPLRIIEMKDENSVPTPVEGAERSCISCGHCVAVCPTSAISLSVMKPEDCPAVYKKMLLGPERAEHFLRSRRSIRTYKNKEIERDSLIKIIDVARYAPTGSNSQQVGWLVINSRDRVRALSGIAIDWMRSLVNEKNPVAQKYRMTGIVSAWDAGIDLICRGAPGLVVTHAPRDYTVAQVDCAIALTFFDLAAPSFNLGTCWAGFFMIAASHWPPLKQALSLPEGHECFGAMMVGYPKYRYHRLPLRKKARVTWQE